MTISVAIIARNSEDVIGRCLESVKGADQIVVVDTGSDTDKTIEIAKSYGAETYTYYECNEPKTKDGLFMNFSMPRNFAIEKCTSTHILTIDCDEELLSDIEDMRKFNGDALSVLCVSGMNREEHRQPRLYRNRSDIRWKGAAHNYLTTPTPIYSEHKIKYHWNNQKKKDPDRTFRILKRWVKDNPRECTRELYYLAKEYYKRGIKDKSERAIRKYIKRSSFDSEKADAYLLLCFLLQARKDNKGALNAAMSAISINPQFSEAYRVLSELSNDVNRLKWAHISTKATDSGTLFKRVDRRRRVTILSDIDYAGCGYKNMLAVKFATKNNIDIEALTLTPGQGTDKFFIKTGPALLEVGKEVAMDRIQSSDVIHFQCDRPMNNFGEIPLPDVPKVQVVGGSFFRKMDAGLIPGVCFDKYQIEDYKVDKLFAITPDLCYENIGWMPHAWIDFNYTYKPGGKFRIVHIPSDPHKKGTALILKAIERLGRKDVEFICETGISYQRSLELKKTAHLYIDQMVIWAYSQAAVEAMSFGVPVVSGIDASLYPPECPVVDVTIKRSADNIAKAIDDVLDWGILRSLSAQSYEYAKILHGGMGKTWMELYKSLT